MQKRAQALREEMRRAVVGTFILRTSSPVQLFAVIAQKTVLEPKMPHAFSESENLPELYDGRFVIPRSACKLLHILKLPPYRRHLRQMRHRHQFP
jgi:hypothetical protein